MKNISRRRFLRTSAWSAGSLVLLSQSPLRATEWISADNEFVTAETTYGKIKGCRVEGVNIFKGVPYAGSVSGKYRFARPAPLQPWTDVRDALALGTPAMQQASTVYGVDEPAPGEDCLFLNVWTPANDGKKRPVIFYNHGGGFATGSGGAAGQDGANLARYFDVVVVETNHRLNIFGFLYLGEIAGEEYKTSGNNGLLDIVDGLKWVHDNIADFGGDPDNVMICGESGGGYKTSCLYGMPLANPYFNKASIESGPGLRAPSLETAAAVADLVFKELNIQTDNWRKILDLPAQAVYAMQDKISQLITQLPLKKDERFGFVPVLDGVAITAHPFVPTAPQISRDKPVMVGWNEDEHTFFAMTSGNVAPLNMAADDFAQVEQLLKTRYEDKAKLIVDTYRQSRPKATAAEIYVAIASVTMMGLGSIEIAEKKTRQAAAPAYLYNFGFKNDAPVPGTHYPMGTPHAMDIAYKFYNVQKGGGLTGDRPERMQASHHFAEIWTSFARTGKPGGKDLPEWPAYNLETRPMMRIDATCEVINDRYKAEREMWTQLGYIQS